MSTCSAKCGIILFNGILLTLSLGLLLAGVLFHKDLYGSASFLSQYICIPTVVSLSLGAFLTCIFSLALLCFVPNIHLYAPYKCFFSGILFLEFITWGATVFLKSFLLGLIIDSLYLAASKYTINSQANLTWDSLQLDYHCCGVYNYTDWFHYLKDSIVPDSCCVNYTIGCGVFNSTHNLVKTGCAEALSKWLDGCLLLTTILFFVFMLLQGISFTLSSKDQGFDSELSPVSTT